MYARLFALALAVPSTAFAIDLSVAPSIAVGEPLVLTVTGALPGQTVLFARGASGGTTCPAVLGGACFALRNPSQLGSVLADASGSAVLTLQIPASAPVGATPRFQAAGVRPGQRATITAPVDSFLIAEATCNNGVWESPEQCDDGNLVARDGCANTCTLDVDFRGPHPTELVMTAGVVFPLIGAITDTCVSNTPLTLVPDPFSGVLTVDFVSSCTFSGLLATFGAGGLSFQGELVGNALVGQADLLVLGAPVNGAAVSWPLAAPGVLDVFVPFDTTVSGVTAIGSIELYSDLSQ